MNDVVSELEEIKDIEQEYFDNMPESVQNSERGEIKQEALDTLEKLTDALDTLDNAVQEVEDAASEVEDLV